MQLSQYTYIVDTLMGGDISNNLIAIKTANGTRLDCLVKDQFEKKFVNSRYNIEEDRTNNLILLTDKSDTAVKYAIPIENIEVISYIER